MTPTSLLRPRPAFGVGVLCAALLALPLWSSLPAFAAAPSAPAHALRLAPAAAAVAPHSAAPSGAPAAPPAPPSCSYTAGDLFVVGLPTSFAVGASVTAYITAIDLSDRTDTTVNNCTASLDLTSSSGAASFGTPSAFTNGVATVSLSFSQPGYQTVTAQDTVSTSVTGTSQKVNVLPLTLTDPAPANANVAADNITFNQVTLPGTPYPTESITLTANYAITISAVSIGAAYPDFAVSSTTCVTALAASNTCTITLQFKPQGPGLRRAPLEVDASGTHILSKYLFNLAGDAVGPLLVYTPGIINTITTSTTDTGDAGGGDFFNGANGYVAFMTLDAAGNKYVSDPVNSVVYQINPSGVTSIYAGTWDAELYSGDGGAATSAALDTPMGLATDAAGNLFIADSANNVIRRVDAATQIITTVAGNSNANSSGQNGGDGGSALAAELHNPQAVAVDATGDLFIGDTSDDSVREVAAGTGLITDYAGTTGTAFSYAGSTQSFSGTPSSISIGLVTGVAVDASGNVFISDAINNVVYKVASSNGAGSMSIYAGTEYTGSPAPNLQGSFNQSGCNSSGSPETSDGLGATSSSIHFCYPQGLALDTAGDLYIADTDNNLVRRVDNVSGFPIRNVAGNFDTYSGSLGGAPYPGDNGAATGGGAAEISNPWSVVLDGVGDLYLTDTFDFTIRDVLVTNGQADDFGAVAAGVAAATQSVIASDVGNATLTFGSNPTITTNPTDFSVTGATTCAGSSPLLQGQSCTVVSDFQPPASDGAGGARSGVATLTDNDLNVTGSTQTIALTGTLNAPGAQLTPSTQSFGAVNLGNTQIETFTLNNNGNVSLTGITSSFTGTNAAEFTDTHMGTCTSSGGTLAASTPPCTIIVKFAPVTNGGSRSATLSVADNAYGQPQTAALSGVGHNINTATHFAVTPSPSTTTAGSDISVTVTAEDSSNDVVESYTGIVTLSSSTDTQAAFPASHTFISTDYGSFTFSNDVLYKTAGTQNITAGDGSITGSNNETVNAGLATKIVATSVNSVVGSTGSASVHTGTYALVATVEDAYNNPVSGTAVTFTPTSGGSGQSAATVGTNPATSGSNGQVAIAYTANNTAGAFSLAASGAGLTSGNFTLTNLAGAAAKLAFTTQPVSTTAGSTLATVAVSVEDQYGNVVTSGAGSTDSISIALSSNSFASGTTTVTAVGGVASFTNLVIDTVATYTLSASDGSRALTPVGYASNSFAIAAGSAASLSISAPSAVGAGAQFSYTVTALDAFGNVATTYSGTDKFTSSDTALGVNLPANSGLTAGSGTFNANLLTGGNQTLTATDTVHATLTATATINVISSTVPFPPTPVGGPQDGPLPVPFSNPGPGPITVGSFNVVTQGLANLDFTAGTGSTCTGTIPAGGTCYVNVLFLPTAVGLRFGAVNLFDGSGNRLTTGYVNGIGDGPIASFGNFSQVLTLTGLNSPAGIAVDAGGNIFELESSVVNKFAAGQTTATTLLTGVSSPYGIAVDGNGNIYISDPGNQRVARVTSAGAISTASGLTGFTPYGVAVDGAGNVYVADGTNNRVLEYVVADGNVVTLGFSNLVAPKGVAVDGADDVFVADGSSTGIVAELTPGGTQTLVGSGWITPQYVAVDPAGDLFVTDSGLAAGSQLQMVAVGGGQSAVAATLAGPLGLAVDGKGNLSVADSGNNRVVVLAFSTPQTMTFTPPGTPGGASQSQSVALSNAGNTALNLTAVGATTSTSTAAAYTTTGSACAATTSLNPGGNCALKVNFAPTLLGTNSGTVTVTDNDLNQTAAAQAFATTGQGVAGAAASIAAYAGTPQNVTVAAAASTPLGAIVKDSFGNVVSGATVTFNVTAGTTALGTFTGSVASATATTNASGIATAPTLTANTAAGAWSVTAAVAGVTTPASFSLTNVAGAATKLVATAGSGQSAREGNAFTTLLQATVEDQYGNPVLVAGTSVTFTAPASGASGAFANGTVTTTAATNAAGVATATAFTASGVVGSYNVTASATALTGANYALSNAIAAGPLTLSVSGLVFGSQPVGTASAAQTISVTNTTELVFSISSLVPSGDYAAVSDCQNIPVNGNCAINVTFSPTAIGVRSGTLTINDALPSSPQTVSLSGYGIAPGILLEPTVLTFGGQTVGTTSTAQTVTILNTGTANLNVASITSSNPQFAANGNCSLVPANTSCSFTVTFTPSATGVQSGTITLNDNAGTGTQTVSVSGYGMAAGIALAPSLLTFPATPLGSTSLTLTTVVTNTGNTPITGLSLGPLGDYFTTSTTCGATLAVGATCNINVKFTPGLAGQDNGLVVLNDSLGQQDIVATGDGLTPGLLIEPSQLIFGGQLVGTQSTAQTVVVTNTSNQAIPVTAVTPSAGFGDTTNCVGSLAAGASCSINVYFAPTAAGPQNGTVTVTGGSGTQTVTTYGYGVNPGLALVPSFLIFGAQELGTTSPQQTLTLTNTGITSLTLTAPVVTGDFAQANNCPATLAPGASCLLSISFTPTALGSRSGAIEIGDSTGAAFTLSVLSGEGVLPGLNVTPANLYFGSLIVGSTSPYQTVTVSNDGTAALIVAGVAGGGDFGETDLCTGTTLQPGQYCIVNADMTPSTAGSRTGAIQVTDNTGAVRQVATNGYGELAVAGIDVTPGILNFGSQPVNPNGAPLEGNPLEVTFTNTGSTPVTITSVGILGDFAQSNSCGTTVAAGASCEFTVSFAPSAQGNRTGLMTITDNVGSNNGQTEEVALVGFGSPGGLTLTPPVLDFGSEVIGQTSAPLAAVLANNTGAAITNLAIGASGEFTETNTCGASLANGANCTINITMTPQASGAISGTVSVGGSLPTAILNEQLLGGRLVPGGEGSGTSSFEIGVVALLGAGIPPGIGLSVPDLSFAVTTIGATSTGETVTITNTGTSLPLLNLGFASGPEFPFTSQCPATLAAQQSCTVTIFFAPQGPGLRSGIFTVSTSNAGSAELPISGQAVGPNLTVTPSSLTFGGWPLFSHSTAQTLTLLDSGQLPLTVTSIGISVGDYTITGSTCGTLPLTLPVNATCTVSVMYAPAALGTRTATVSVGSNSYSGTSYTAITGTATTAGLEISPTSLTFGEEGVGVTSAAQTVTLTNINNVPVSLAGITVSGDFSETSNCPATLAAGASCTVLVTFKPTATGTRTGTLNVSDGAGLQSIGLTGSAGDFSLTYPGQTISAVTWHDGQITTYTLNLVSLSGDTQNISLTCLPQNEFTCSVSPATLAINGTTSTVTLRLVDTGVPGLRPSGGIPFPAGGSFPAPAPWLLLAAAGLALAGLAAGRRRRLTLAGALLLGLLSAGCGTGGPQGGVTTWVTVTGTSSLGNSHSVSVNLITN